MPWLWRKFAGISIEGETCFCTSRGFTMNSWIRSSLASFPCKSKSSLTITNPWFFCSISFLSSRRLIFPPFVFKTKKIWCVCVWHFVYSIWCSLIVIGANKKFIFLSIFRNLFSSVRLRFTILLRRFSFSKKSRKTKLTSTHAQSRLPLGFCFKKVSRVWVRRWFLHAPSLNNLLGELKQYLGEVAYANEMILNRLSMARKLSDFIIIFEHPLDYPVNR